jgi:hypothetical protein
LNLLATYNHHIAPIKQVGHLKSINTFKQHLVSNMYNKLLSGWERVGGVRVGWTAMALVEVEAVRVYTDGDSANMDANRAGAVELLSLC